MALIYKPKRTTTASKVPTTADLADGELCVNSTDRKLYIRVGAAIVDLSSSASSAVWGEITGALSAQADLAAALAAKADALGTLTYKGLIPGATDLDSYVTAGLYMQSSNVNAASGSNYPVAQAGMLEVINAGVNYVWQKYRHYNSDVIYVRMRTGGVWSAWAVEWNTSTFDPASKLDVTAQAADSTLLMGKAAASAGTADTVAVRNTAGDIVTERLFRSGYGDQLDCSGAIAFRKNNTTDNYIRFCSAPGSVRDWLGLGSAALLPASDAASNGTVVQRTASGYINANYFNTSALPSVNVPSSVFMEHNGDGYIRPQALADFAANLITNTSVGAKGMVLGGAITTRTLTQADAGMYYYTGTGGITITCPSSGITAGEIITIFNRSTSNLTITGAGIIRLAGTATTGARTLGPYGIATIIAYSGGSEFWVSGPGVS